MIFQPVLHPVVLILIFVPLMVLAVGAVVGWTPFVKKPAGATPPIGLARWPWILRAVMVLACFVMLLRPGIPGGSTTTLATNTDVILVVDTTASIVAEDWDGAKPRLDGVREDVKAIAAKYPGARFSLITFDATPQVRLPLTTDTTALASVMSILTPEVTAQSQGSSIGVAAATVAETLDAAAENSPDRSRMVFYFGDGEQTASTEPESFASSAKLVDGGAVLGYGTAKGGAMKMTTGQVREQPSYIEYQGQRALSTIDEKNLTAIAKQLDVPLELRDAATTLRLPDAPTTTTTSSDSAGTTGNVIELYWIPASLMMLLLAAEACVAALGLVRLRGLVRPGGEA